MKPFPSLSSWSAARSICGLQAAHVQPVQLPGRDLTTGRVVKHGQGAPGSYRVQSAGHVDAFVKVKASHLPVALAGGPCWLQHSLVTAAARPLDIYCLVFAWPRRQSMDVQVEVETCRLALSLEHVHDWEEAAWCRCLSCASFSKPQFNVRTPQD